ncbi:MAG: type II secretion system secretin GspD [Deltaproteobacteria bacterium]|nr:type II secretion system secretin GspD [Deltaproteobacteria bacterium]
MNTTKQRGDALRMISAPHPKTSHRRSVRLTVLASTVTLASLLGTAERATAQDQPAAPSDAKPTPTRPNLKAAANLKSRAKTKGRFINRNGVKIPTSLPPGLKAELASPVKASEPAKLRPRPSERRRAKKASAPAPQPPPAPVELGAAPEGGEGLPNFEDLKKAGTKRCRPLPSNAKVTFDFKGELQELVETISKTTCKNFIITNKVRSQKFEILSPSPITVEESWRAFLSALEANDFTLIQVGRYYKIIQAPEATRSPVPIYDADEAHPVNDRMVTKIWKVQYASDINAVVNYLNIFKSGKGQIHAFQATGTLICTDYGTSITRLERVLEEVDQPGVLERLRVVQVQYAAAAEIAERLTQVFEPQKPGATKAAAKIARAKGLKKPGLPRARGRSRNTELTDDSVSVSKILADVRTNKLIIIASDQAFKQMLALMRELDVPDQGGGQIQVVRLKHADAEALASTLASLAQGRPTTARPRTAAKTPVANAGATTALFEGDVKVTADKATNSLVITASKSDFNSMRSVIDRLDVPRYQVFVEAIIMEVSVRRNRQLGAGWHGGISPTIDGQRSPILFGNTPAKELSSLLAASNPLSLAGLVGFASAVKGPTLPGTESITGASGGIPALGVVIQALQTTNDVNVISTPHLLTMDNEEAEIKVNEKRPFSSGLSLGNISGLAGSLGQAGSSALGNLAGLGLGSVSFNREDVGLELKLKPQINDDEYVRLEIDQKLSDVAGVDKVTGQTITSNRSAKTVVVVRSQDSVVIGGLVRERESVDESKMPLFGDLPLIGWLFKSQQKSRDKVNLVLVLTPYIIRGPDDFRKIYERKMAEREQFASQFYGEVEEPKAEIDWDRKVGPLAAYRATRARALLKAENDGPGEEGETVIRADEPESREITPNMSMPLTPDSGGAPEGGQGLEGQPPSRAPSDPARRGLRPFGRPDVSSPHGFPPGMMPEPGAVPDGAQPEITPHRPIYIQPPEDYTPPPQDRTDEP